MLTTATIAEIAALVGDPARAAMLLALMDGRALTAGELAHLAGVSAPTTSGHLARLTEAGLLAVERQGRHRYHRLASPLVAAMLESIMAVGGEAMQRLPKIVRTGPRQAALRRARTCYDHLAGRIAVAMTDRMIACGHLDLAPDGAALTSEGDDFLRLIGVDIAPLGKQSGGGRRFCRPCFDWSERRPHLAGAVGSALLETCIARDWMRRVKGSREVLVSPAGRRALDRAFALDESVWHDE